jgi:pimeloyl-ACP methyl ester carboxylesterase
MHAERFGFGDRAVVLLHGFGTSSFVWRAVAPALPLGRVTAYTIDLFGHGESDRVLDADYGIDAQADYLDRALTVLRVARADLVALDVACAVALQLAHRRPDRVRSLVLINPTDPAGVRGGDLDALQRLVARHVLDSSRGMLGAQALLGPLLEKSVADPARMPAALAGRYIAPYVGRDGVRHLLQLERAISDRALDRVEWAARWVPATVFRGEADGWVAAPVALALAQRLRGEFQPLPGIARLWPEDDPAGCAARLAALVQGDAG